MEDRAVCQTTKEDKSPSDLVPDRSQWLRSLRAVELSGVQVGEWLKVRRGTVGGSQVWKWPGGGQVLSYDRVTLAREDPLMFSQLEW